MNIADIRQSDVFIICRGSHQKIIQSILDFDYLCDKSTPSVKAIVSKGQTSGRFFFGNREVLIPFFEELSQVPLALRRRANFFLNLSSGRRVADSTIEAIDMLPTLIGAAIFAENTPERHSLKLIEKVKNSKVWVVGPSSVGFCMPGVVKLGAIGGIDHHQITGARLMENGKAAVLSSSGGMTNELINVASGAGLGISFSLSFGGDRFPILSPEAAFLAAEKDAKTKAIIYFGELGGDDEYKLVELIKKRLVKKPVIAYIGGSVSELFASPPQFGHAKAMAATADESAIAKRLALRKVGAKAPNSFGAFLREIDKLAKNLGKLPETKPSVQIQDNRKPALFASSIVGQAGDGELIVAGQKLSLYASQDFGTMVATMLLGHKSKSKELPALIELVFKLLADHGPHVSGAVNTMVAARAGKDLVSSLAAGLLTIGPRFGGAINDAARAWHKGVREKLAPAELVEQFAREGRYILGIGHKKYRIDNPDPRVKLLLASQKSLGLHVKFAQGVEQITSTKSGNLILNVDGAIAACLLDVLSDKEKLSDKEIEHLIDIEFFNALFVLARSIGLTAHYLDQRRIDEGLFRLPEDQVAEV